MQRRRVLGAFIVSKQWFTVFLNLLTRVRRRKLELCWDVSRCVPGRRLGLIFRNSNKKQSEFVWRGGQVQLIVGFTLAVELDKPHQTLYIGLLWRAVSRQRGSCLRIWSAKSAVGSGLV